MSNSDKTILVTGASGGIGRAIALYAAKAGYYVICHYNRGIERAQETLNLIKSEDSVFACIKVFNFCSVFDVNVTCIKISYRTNTAFSG